MYGVQVYSKTPKKYERDKTPRSFFDAAPPHNSEVTSEVGAYTEKISIFTRVMLGSLLASILWLLCSAIFLDFSSEVRALLFYSAVLPIAPLETPSIAPTAQFGSLSRDLQC